MEETIGSHALVVQGVSKKYEIYERPADRLKQFVLPRVSRRLLGRERNYFREFWALRDVSLTLERGDAIGILGRNGAGKSTLLQIIAGTLTPTTGEVAAAGKVAALLELGSGFSPEFTGRENVGLSASLLGLTPEEIAAAFDQIVAFADIGDFLDQPVKTYSTGMMLRLAFAVQTAVEPDLMIVDEALAVGDAKFQKKCFTRLEQLRNKGTTLLLVTHDTNTVLQVCTRALILEGGRIFAAGDPQSVSRQYHRLLFEEAERAAAPRPPDGAENEQGEADANGTTADIGASSSQPGSSGMPSEAAAEPSPAGREATGREVRYGDRRVEIVDVGVRSADGSPAYEIETHQEVVFYFRARFHEDIDENVAYGFIISNARGIEVYGTKAAMFKRLLPPSKQGTEFECRLRVRVSLVPQNYFLSVAVAYDDPKIAYYDYRFDCLEVRVTGDPRCFTTSIVDLAGVIDFGPGPD